MQSKYYWLYFEPYVYISCNDNGSIIFNTLNSSYLKYPKNTNVTSLLKKVILKNNLFVIHLNNNELQEKEIIKFIRNIKNNFMGDILPKKWSSQKPIQAIPIIRIENIIKISKKNEDIKEMENLNEIIISLNSDTDEISCIEKQLNFNNYNSSINKQIDFKIIESLLSDFSSCRFIFSGADIFNYNYFNNLIKDIENKNINTVFNINYLNENITKHKLDLLKRLDLTINILVSTPVNTLLLKTILHNLNINRLNYFIVFLIEEENNVIEFEQLINEFNIKYYSFNPFYNKKNIGFFENSIFQNEEDILSSEVTIQNILTRQEINPHDFGKLIIRSNSDIYANLNHPKLGNLKKRNIFEIVHDEIFNGNSWLSLRKNIEPCKHCKYNLLCPPLSNYEYAIGKNNLCHVWEE